MPQKENNLLSQTDIKRSHLLSVNKQLLAGQCMSILKWKINYAKNQCGKHQSAYLLLLIGQRKNVSGNANPEQCIDLTATAYCDYVDCNSDHLRYAMTNRVKDIMMINFK